MLNWLFRSSALYVGLFLGAFVPALISHNITRLYTGLGIMGAVIIFRMVYILEQIYKKLERS